MKKCGYCHSEKKFSEFSFKSKSRGTLQNWCKSCQKLYKDEHYKQNSSFYVKKARERNLKTRKLYREKIVKILENNPCVDCGERDIFVLEFDHVRGKKVECISKLVQDVVSWKRIESEIAKCEVRCANCHRRKTIKQFGFYEVKTV